MFNHVEVDTPTLNRKDVNGVRYYDTPSGKKLVSITSVISHYNRQIFADWRKKIGNEEANKITKQATSRGTDTHTLIEHYLKNEELPTVQPLSDMLFKIAKPDLNNIDNIHGLEKPLYSEYLGIAGTVDCIAEHNNELAIIDFKTSKKPKKREWIEGYFVPVSYTHLRAHET